MNGEEFVVEAYRQAIEPFIGNRTITGVCHPKNPADGKRIKIFLSTEVVTVELNFKVELTGVIAPQRP